MKTNRKNIIGLFLVSIFLIGISSCMKNWNIDEIDKLSDEIGVEPSFVFPVLNTEIKFRDLLSNNPNSYIDTNSTDGLLKLIVKMDIPTVNATKYMVGFPLSGTNLQAITYPVDVAKTDLGANSNTFSGEIYFKAPKVTMNLFCNLSNQVQFYYTFNNLTMYDKNGNTVALTGDNIGAGKKNYLNYGETQFELNRDNSNIDQVISTIPTAYSWSMVYGNEAYTGVYSFNKDAILSGNITMEIPFEVMLNNYIIGDTTDFTFPDNVDDFRPNFNVYGPVTNGFPLKLTIDMYFADENFVVLDKFMTTQINGANVDGTGSVTSPTTGSINAGLLYERVKNYHKQVKKIIIKASLSTSNAAPSSKFTVKFLTRYKLQIKLAMKADAKISNN